MTSHRDDVVLRSIFMSSRCDVTETPLLNNPAYATVAAIAYAAKPVA